MKLQSKWVPSPLQAAAYLFIVLVILAATIGPLLATYGAQEVAGPPLRPPSWEFWFGTDNLGRDMFSYTVIGARSTMLISLSVAGFALVVGAVFGALAGYFGGWLDAVISRIMEFFQIVPAFVIALTTVAILGNTTFFVIVALAAGMWARMARLARAQFMTYRDRDFVANAKIQGVGSGTIMVRDIAPNVSAPILVQFTLDVGMAALFYAGITFLGLGDPNVPNWGFMLSVGQHYLQTAPWVSVTAGVSIILTVLSFNIVADHLSNALDNRRAAR